ncbi:hypothetical protein MYK68_15880 [Gordonia sp. PP30]|uniref:hypothetical protein n=1 Tax=Gordonia sp. PP30 TaxID=2935861 RepID=UPI001FFECAC8|nr:hypothetical protein [Gordonia sp. PP30]UQE74190.1 hypothetical protein MYK68_15880 [Gordonia sp. PP30]
MDDIQIDEDGAFHCAKCGGTNFSEKRTTRAKVGGGAAAVFTFGIAGAAAPLLTKKKLWCQQCGTYNKMGNAQPYVPSGTAPPKSAVDLAQDEARAKMERNAAQRAAREAGAPSSGRAGQYLTVKKPMKP